MPSKPMNLSIGLEIQKMALRRTLEFQMLVMEFIAFGIDPPPLEEIRQLSATTKLTFAGAAQRILEQKLRKPQQQEATNETSTN